MSDEVECKSDQILVVSDQVVCKSDEVVCGSDQVVCANDEILVVSDEVVCKSDEVKCSHDEVECSHDEGVGASDETGGASAELRRPAGQPLSGRPHSSGQVPIFMDTNVAPLLAEANAARSSAASISSPTVRVARTAAAQRSMSASIGA